MINLTPAFHPLDVVYSEWEERLKQANPSIRKGELQTRTRAVFEAFHAPARSFTDASNSLFSHGFDSFDDSPPLSVSRRLLSRDGSERFLWLTRNGYPVESVLLPYKKRLTLCISVQSGCSLSCPFCATGELPFRGNLSIGEILFQVYETEYLRQERVNNIVYMGMGEPFYNYRSTLESARILSHPWGHAIGARHITISTAGVLPEVERYAEEGAPFVLAWSLHAADSAKRRLLVPLEKKYPAEDMIAFLSKHRNSFRKKGITLEYTMIRNFNMSEDDAKLLSDVALNLKAGINLIPLNRDCKAGDVDLERPSSDEIDLFWSYLYKRGAVAINRGSRGLDINGACGMLSGEG